MAGTEKTARIATATRGIPAGRNPYPNYTADPNYGCCCTARTWTLVFITLKFVGVGILLFMASLLYAGSESARHEFYVNGKPIPPETEDVLAVADLLATVYFWIALPFLLVYCVMLFGIIKEKLVLITLYIFWLVLEIVVLLGLNVFLVAVGKKLVSSVASSVFSALFWGTIAILCAVAFRKRVALRKSQSLESEPNAFYSV